MGVLTLNCNSAGIAYNFKDVAYILNKIQRK